MGFTKKKPEIHREKQAMKPKKGHRPMWELTQNHSGSIVRSAIRLLAIASCCLAVIGTPAPTFSQPPAPLMSRAQLAVEEALALKILADECFLADRRDEAKRYYQSAQRLLDAEAPVGSAEGGSQTTRLLRLEIAYRVSLVNDPKMDFWGPEFSLTPEQPRAAYRRFKETLTRFNQEVETILAEREKIRDSDYRGTLTAVERERSRVQISEEEIKTETAKWRSDFHTARVAQASQRILEISGQVQRLRAEQDKLFGELKSLDTDLNSAAMQLFSQSAGLPLTGPSQVASTTTIVGQGNILDRGLLQAASLLGRSKQFAASVQQVTGANAQILDIFQRADLIFAKVQRTRNSVEQVRGLVRNPTFNSLGTLGNMLFEKLAPSSRVQWTNFVAQAKPLMPLLVAARGKDQLALRRAIADQLRLRGVPLPPGDIDANILEAHAQQQIRGLVQNEVRKLGVASFEEIGKLRPDLQAKVPGLTQVVTGQFFDGVVAQLTKIAPNDVAKAFRPVVEFDLAANFITNHPEQAAAVLPTAPTVPGEFVAQPAPQPASVEKAQQVLRLGMGAASIAFPPFALTQASLKILDGIGKSNAIGGALNGINSEVERYLVEEAQLRDLIDASLAEKARQKLETDLAAERSRAALSDVKLWQLASEQTVDAAEASRRKILLAMSRTFFYAEALRLDFDTLDRAMGLWSGALESNRGNIRAAIENNPANLRLALDPEIQVFSWLAGGREIERRRDDLLTLVNHWKDIDALVEREVNKSTTISIGVVGAENYGISLKNLVSQSDWKRFQEWQRNKGREGSSDPRSFQFAALIHPEYGPDGVPLCKPEKGLRVVTALVGSMAQPGSRPTLNNGIELSHPGFAYVPTNDAAGQRRYVKEMYKPIKERVNTPFAPAGLETEKLDALRERWDKEGNYRMKPFEGYGLFTTWFVEVQPTSTNFDLTDIRLQFIYQYVPQPMKAIVGAETQFDPNRRGAMTVNTRYLAPLGDRFEINRKLRDVRWGVLQTSAGILPPWSFGAEMGIPATSIPALRVSPIVAWASTR